MTEDNSPLCVDLFSGSGGFSTGFKKAGYKIVLAVEKNTSAAETYSANHPETAVIKDDIKNIKVMDLELKSKIDIIIGGFPCKPFSSANRTNSGTLHKDNQLYLEFLSFLRHIEPRQFVIENVPGLKSQNKVIIESILDTTKGMGYKVEVDIINMAKYGLPQERERIFIIGSKSKPINFPESVLTTADKWITVGEAISDLQEEVCSDPSYVFDYQVEPKNTYQIMRRYGSFKLYNHFCTDHSEKVLQKIRCIPPGGNWRNIPYDLLTKQERTNKHSNSYRRLRNDNPSPTITNIRKTVLIHPQFQRTLSAREGARLQGFDDTYLFKGTKDDVLQQIADAVPPIISECLANKLIAEL